MSKGKTAPVQRLSEAASIDAQKKKEMYILWRSIPALLRVLPAADMRKMGYDVDDPLFQKLLTINNEGEFVVMFGVSNNQPRRWREDPEIAHQIEKVSQINHILRFEKDIDFSFTQKVIREADPARVKLWKQLFRGWTEKTEAVVTNRNINMVELVKEIEKRNAAYRMPKPKGE